MPLRLLIVEDDETVRTIIGDVLTDDGHEVITAENGAAALEIFQRDPVPVVVTDIVMEKMNGIELLQAIKAASPETLVIVMTSHASLETAMQALRAGAYDYMIKPFDDLDIISTVVNRASERVELTRDRAQLIAHLETQAAELAEANRALTRAKELAEEATDSKSRFLANMSHEIRTPMNGVLGMLDLLIDMELGDVQREYATMARNSADALLTLINDILDFSKIEAGKLSIVPVSFDLRRGVEELAELLNPSAEEKNLDLVVRFDPSAPRHVVGDAGRIRQVITNFAGNSIKFTHAGHVLIDVACPDHTDTTARYRFTVADTGIGIARANLDRLFEMFTQADPSTTRRYGGTGLGLAISRQLVELMNGSIGVQSREGRGSSFWFELDLPLDVSMAHDPEVDLGGFRVLIVDENDMTAQVVAQELEARGAFHEEVPDAEHAFEAMSKAARAGKPFGAVLVDSRGDKGAIASFVAGVRGLSGCPETPIVLISSVAQRWTGAELEELEVAGHISRPVKMRQLTDTISGIVENSRRPELIGAPAEHPVSEIATSPPTAQPPEGFCRRRVLVAEDNRVNQLVIERMLEGLGCRVDVAANGFEAIDAVSRFHYDVVFMDCQMPDMDGYDATRHIRALETGGEHRPIIAMTANAMDGARELCLEAGMDDYAAKPVDRATIQQLLERWAPELRDAS